jgi:hypothetical protein
MKHFTPPFTSVSLDEALRERGFAVLRAEWLRHAAGVSADELDAIAAEWDDLPPDPYLKDGGHYRRRRHASLVVDAGACTAVPHRPHYQSLDYNALHGGMERWFEPVAPRLVAAPAFLRLVETLAGLASTAAGERRWFVEAHQFRIDTAEGIGRPTPEGAHRDGVDFVAVALVQRARIIGGETRVFDAESPHGVRFTMTEPWTLLFLDDSRVVHESTPIQPQTSDSPGYRDTLVVTFRQGGFQQP